MNSEYIHHKFNMHSPSKVSVRQAKPAGLDSDAEMAMDGVIAETEQQELLEPAAADIPPGQIPVDAPARQADRGNHERGSHFHAALYTAFVIIHTTCKWGHENDVAVHG